MGIRLSIAEPITTIAPAAVVAETDSAVKPVENARTPTPTAATPTPRSAI